MKAEYLKTVLEQEAIDLCTNSFSYFAKAWLQIVSDKHGLIPFNLYPYQERLAKTYEQYRFVIYTKFRFGGFTTFNALWILWKVMFSPNQSIMYNATSDRAAREAKNIIDKTISWLPDWLKFETNKNNDHQLIFAHNGSSIRFYTMEAACGKATDYLFIEEAAFIKNMNNHWTALYPTLCNNGRCVVLSTPNGKNNWFHKTYTAENTNWYKFHCNYQENPDLTAERINVLKDGLGEKGWRQEFLQEFLD